MDAIAGVILAGGAALRAGGEKALAPFLSGTLLDAVIARAAPQVGSLAINVPAAKMAAYRERYGQRFPLLRDPFPPGTGPLSGIVAGLEWLKTLGHPQWLASFPCDTPFLPADLVAQLASGAANVPVAARDAERLQGVCAIWPAACLDRLRDGVAAGTLRSLYSALEALGGETRLIAADGNAFFNINAAEDMARAEAIARGR